MQPRGSQIKRKDSFFHCLGCFSEGWFSPVRDTQWALWALLWLVIKAILKRASQIKSPELALSYRMGHLRISSLFTQHLARNWESSKYPDVRMSSPPVTFPFLGTWEVQCKGHWTKFLLLTPDKGVSLPCTPTTILFFYLCKQRCPARPPHTAKPSSQLPPLLLRSGWTSISPPEPERPPMHRTSSDSSLATFSAS